MNFYYIHFHKPKFLLWIFTAWIFTPWIWLHSFPQPFIYYWMNFHYITFYCVYLRSLHFYRMHDCYIVYCTNFHNLIFFLHEFSRHEFLLLEILPRSFPQAKCLLRECLRHSFPHAKFMPREFLPRWIFASFALTFFFMIWSEYRCFNLKFCHLSLFLRCGFPESEFSLTDISLLEQPQQNFSRAVFSWVREELLESWASVSYLFSQDRVALVGARALYQLPIMR